MVRPCVARRLRRIGGGGLASMYPASEWSICSGPSWISARVGSHYRTGLDRGHLGHQCSHALGRPILHLVLFSRRPRLETVDRVTSSLAPDIAQFLCSSQGSVPSSRPTERRSRRAQGRSRPARRTWLAAGSGVARLRLDRAEHGARITRVGRRLHRRSSSARRRVVVGRCTASAIASASLKSFFCPLL